MAATPNIQIEKELSAGEQVIKTIESKTDLSEVSRRTVVSEIKMLQHQHRWFKSGGAKSMAITAVANLVIGTFMIIFVSPGWGLICYMGVAIGVGGYAVGFLGSRKYLRTLQQYSPSSIKAS